MPTFKEFLRVAEVTLHDKTSGKRMMEIQRILRKSGVLKGLTPEKAVTALEQLGPTFVKMGQLASNRSDILPQEYCNAFMKLHANVQPMPFDTIISEIEKSYGHSWARTFSSLEEKPLGSASIAQVHKGVLHDGSVVAVKVRRPGIVEGMAEDIALIRHLLALVEFSHIADENLLVTFDDLIQELERTTADEVDFSVEINNLIRFYVEIQNQEKIVSPLPYPDHSTDAVLVMEFATGIFVNEIDKLQSQDVDLEDIGRRLAKSYVMQVINEGFFHADPHAGNILIRNDTIIWLDLGMTGELSGKERSAVSEVFQAVALRDSYALKEALLGISRSRGAIDHSLLLEQMGNLINSYSSLDLSDIDLGAVFIDIIEILRTQKLSLPPSISMLARGFMTIEGVLAQIAPSISVISIVSDYVLRQRRNLSYIEGKFKELAASSVHSVEAMTHLPTQASNSLDMLNRGQLKFNMAMKFPENELVTLYDVGGNIALAMISAGLFVGSSLLSTTGLEPRLLGVPMLGILGFFGAFILGVYVVVRVFFSRRQVRKGKKKGK